MVLGIKKENVHHVSDTTVTQYLEVFAKTICTSLPYSIATQTLPPPHSPEDPTFTDAMCSEDTIFLVDVSHLNTIVSFAEHIFAVTRKTAITVVF